MLRVERVQAQVDEDGDEEPEPELRHAGALNGWPNGLCQAPEPQAEVGV